jgi:hypothetical protein
MLRRSTAGPTGWPDQGETLSFCECLLVTFNAERWHRIHAERGLAILEEQ